MPTEHDDRRTPESLRRRADMNLESEVHDLNLRLSVLTSRMEQVRENVEKLVTRHEFTPVKMIVYGLAGGALTTLLAGILNLIMHK